MATTPVRSIVIYVRDPETSQEFYELALGAHAQPAAAGRVELQVGDIRLLLHPTTVDELDEVVARHSRTEIYFSCDDVDARTETLRRAGAHILAPPTDQPWGERDAAVMDPDGLPLFLTQRQT